MSRRTTRPVSWLTIIQTASAAFTGDARLVEDKWIPAKKTTFRGAGHHLTVEIVPRRSLFGALPKSKVRLQGIAKRAPDKRLKLDEPRFPPDTLRQETYWEYARFDVVQPVVVFLADPAAVYLLTGPDDDLPDAVVRIHQWTTFRQIGQYLTVLGDLMLKKPGCSPVAYAAGFELLLKTTIDLPKLVDYFFKLSSVPGAATQDVLSQLNTVAMSLSKVKVSALARQLLTYWSKEVEPAALLGYMTWFDAQRRAWSDNPKLKVTVVAGAKRAVALRFSGPYASAWQQRVRQQAAFLLSD